MERQFVCECRSGGESRRAATQTCRERRSWNAVAFGIQGRMIRIAIIEDSQELREALRQLIGGSEGYQVSGAFRCMEEALEALPRDLPDVALVDLGLPGMSGIDGIRQLAQLYPRLHLLVLSVYGDDDRIFDPICAGACGYLLKKTPPARLLESISDVPGAAPPLSP